MAAIRVLYLGETQPPNAGVALQVSGDGLQIVTDTDPSPPVSSPMQMPRDRWVCVELAIDVQNTQGAVTATVDGASFSSSTPMDTRPGAGFDQVAVGVESSAPEQGPGELFVDEVIVSRSPIGC